MTVRLIVVFICMVVGALIGVSIGGFFGAQSVQARLERQSEAALGELIDIDQAFSLLAASLAHRPLENCAPETLAALRAKVFEFSAIHDIVLVDQSLGGGKRAHCSAMLGDFNDVDIREGAMARGPADRHFAIAPWPPRSGPASFVITTDTIQAVFNELAVREVLNKSDQVNLFTIDARDRIVPFWGDPPFAGQLNGDAPLMSHMDSKIAYVGDCDATIALCAYSHETRAEFAGDLAAARFVGGSIVALFAGLLGSIGYSIRLERRTPERRAQRAVRKACYGFRYQPIIDLRTGAVEGVETLLRPSRRFRDLPTPAVIKAAGTMKRTPEIARRALRAAISEFADLLKAPRHFVVTVNVDPSDLLDDEFLETLHAVVADHNVPRARVALEITETASATSPAVVAAINRLANVGYCMVIDDFGAGYANLSYLGTLNVHVVKLDRSFTNAAHTGSAKERVLKSIIAMAREIETRVVVEGIETAEQERYFRELDGDYGQGWRFARDMTRDDFDAWREAFSHTADARAEARERLEMRARRTALQPPSQPAFGAP